jgi:hypothetical protein
MTPPSSGLNKKPSKKSARRRYCFYWLHVGFFVELFFYPEDGGDMFLQNIS